jgi:flagellar motility protein MotE (MotC chaperone)
MKTLVKEEVKLRLNALSELIEVRKELKKLEKQEEELVEGLTKYVKKHGSMTYKDLIASIETTSARYPKWKEEYIKDMGAEKAAYIMEHTEPTVKEKLVVKTKEVIIEDNDSAFPWRKTTAVKGRVRAMRA